MRHVLPHGTAKPHVVQAWLGASPPSGSFNLPFQTFSKDRLEQVLAQHPVSHQGRSYISEALTAPSRNARGTTKNVVTDVACPKMGFNIQSELKTVHAPQIRQHAFNPQTVGYVTLPPPLEISYRTERGRSVRTLRQVECLVFDREEGVTLETWGRKRSTEGEDGPDEPDTALQAVADAAKRLGFAYRHVAFGSVSGIRDRNHKYLWTYLYSQATDHYASKLSGLLDLFRLESYAFFTELEQRGADIDLLHWAIARGHLHMDFDSFELGQQNDKVLLFRNPEALAAWKLIHPSAAARPTPVNEHRENELRFGDLISFDGRALTVSFVGSTAIHGTDSSGGYVELSYATLNAQRDKLILPERLRKPIIPGPIWKATPGQLQAAIKALETLDMLERGEPLDPDHQRSSSTIRRWKRTIREGQTLGLSAIEALVAQRDKRGFYGPHIDRQLSEDINAEIRRRQKNRQKPSISQEYESVKEAIKETGRRMIARSCFFERWKYCRDLSSVAAQEGHKTAYKHSPVYWQLHLDTPVHARRALESVHLDSTLLDIVVVSSLSGEVLGRPWLTVAMCAATRRVVGMHLSFRPPSYISSMSVLADIVKRFGRLPDSIIHDWGSEFKKKEFKQALTALRIERHVRAKSGARFGSVLERLFGLTLTELIHNAPGNTKMTKRVRELTKAVDPSTHSGLTLLYLLEALESYFFSIYDTRKHPTTLCQPRNGFDTSFISDGLRPHRMVQLADIHPLLCPHARTKPATVDPARGVFVNYQYYGHPLLIGPNRFDDVMLKPVVGDPSVIYAFIAGEWRICRASSFTEMQHLPEAAKRCLYEELWFEQKLVTASHDQARAKVRELLDQLNQQALKTKEYFKDRSLQELLQVASVNTKPPESSDEEPRARKFVDLMRSAAAEVLASNQYGNLVGEPQ